MDRKYARSINYLAFAGPTRGLIWYQFGGHAVSIDSPDTRVRATVEMAYLEPGLVPKGVMIKGRQIREWGHLVVARHSVP
jgi:hypothetical protein